MGIVTSRPCLSGDVCGVSLPDCCRCPFVFLSCSAQILVSILTWWLNLFRRPDRSSGREPLAEVFHCFWFELKEFSSGSRFRVSGLGGRHLFGTREYNGGLERQSSWNFLHRMSLQRAGCLIHVKPQTQTTAAPCVWSRTLEAWLRISVDVHS